MQPESANGNEVYDTYFPADEPPEVYESDVASITKKINVNTGEITEFSDTVFGQSP